MSLNIKKKRRNKNPSCIPEEGRSCRLCEVPSAKDLFHHRLWYIWISPLKKTQLFDFSLVYLLSCFVITMPFEVKHNSFGKLKVFDFCSFSTQSFLSAHGLRLQQRAVTAHWWKWSRSGLLPPPAFSEGFSLAWSALSGRCNSNFELCVLSRGALKYMLTV